MTATETSAFPRVAVSVKEFCVSTSISRAKFYEAVKAGEIEIVKFGRRTLVPATEQQRLIDRLRKKAA